MVQILLEGHWLVLLAPGVHVFLHRFVHPVQCGEFAAGCVESGQTDELPLDFGFVEGVPSLH